MAKKVEATREIHRNLLASSRDSSAFWKLVHTFTKKCTDSSNLDALEVFSHFKKLNANLSMEGPTICAARVVSIPELDGDILSADVCTAIKQLKASKSPGMDGLPPSLFKNCQGKLITLITSLFNKVMSTGEYPECWSNGLICSIHKSGPKSVLDNYRGITLLNVMGKLFTTILNQRLTSWAYDMGHLPECQFGFRTDRRTTDCLFILNTLIEKSLSEKNSFSLVLWTFVRHLTRWIIICYGTNSVI